MTSTVDKNSYAYKTCMESFRSISIDMPTTERYGYANLAMEAITGPDSGMVVEKLYKSVMKRSGANFGTIPASQGDLTKFNKYDSIVDSLALLHRDLDQLNIHELRAAQELHDNLIRLRMDFEYGFKHDSLFLKTNYNTMVYALCEMVNLVTVIYVDNLKAKAEGKPFEYKPYSGLILVQNVDRFNGMVKSGEWARTMATMKLEAKNLTGTLTEESGSPLGWLASFFIGGSALGAFARQYDKVKLDATGPVDAVKKMGGKLIDSVKGAWGKDGTIGGKLATIAAAVALLFLIERALMCLYWKAKYTLRDSLKDQEELLKANMTINSNSDSTALEKQQAMYNFLKGTRDRIERGLLADDATAKKEISQDNKENMIPTQLTTTSQSDYGGYVIG